MFYSQNTSLLLVDLFGPIRDNIKSSLAAIGSDETKNQALDGSCTSMNNLWTFTFNDLIFFNKNFFPSIREAARKNYFSGWTTKQGGGALRPDH